MNDVDINIVSPSKVNCDRKMILDDAVNSLGRRNYTTIKLSPVDSTRSSYLVYSCDSTVTVTIIVI